MKQSEVQKELERFRDYVIKEARSNLTRSQKNVSKGLYESLKGNVKAMPNSLSMEFEMNQYGQFQDKGVKGANPSLVNDVLSLGFIFKNEEHFNNDWITGTPDVNTNEILLDIKCSYEAHTFPFFEDEIDAFQIALISKTYYENDANKGYRKEAPPVDPGIHRGDHEEKD